jgi:uncharacterized membrane protein (DUF4010 family)
LNPHFVWRLTVLVMLMNAAGYVSARVLGQRWGLPVAGLLGGFVSSAAVVAAMGRRSRASASALPGAVAAASWSSIATGVQLAAVLSATNMELLGIVALPLLAFVLVAGFFGVSAGRAAFIADTPASPIVGRAFDPATAVVVAALFAGMSLTVGLAHRFFSSEGALVATLLGAFLDAHAAAASVGGLQASGAFDLQNAAIGVALALSANTTTKLALAAGVGGAHYFARLAPSLVGMIAAFWVLLLVRG